MGRLSILETPQYNIVQQGYDRMWSLGRNDIQAGSVDADPVPDATSLRWGVSVVAVIQHPLAAQFELLTRQCREMAGSNHTFYNHNNLHVTIRSCEFYRPELSATDPLIATYQVVLNDIGKTFGSFEIAYQGLNANRTGIIVQGYPLDTTLQTLREALHVQLNERAAQQGPEAQQVRRTSHVSLTVFGGPVDHPTALFDWIEHNRTTWFGVVRIQRLALVKYHRTAYDVVITPLAETILANE